MSQYRAKLDASVNLLTELPEQMEVRIHRDSAARSYFVMPAAQQAAGELSDADLELVAGGKGDGGSGGGAGTFLPVQGTVTTLVGPIGQPVGTIVVAAVFVV
jgi:hypothetical protein